MAMLREGPYKMSTDVGGTYRSTMEVYNDVGVLTEPATKACTITLPDQTTTSGTIISDGAGTLYCDYVVAHEGIHRFDWVTTVPTTSKTDYENGILYRSVLGLGEMRNHLRITDTTRDEILRGLMMTATTMAERIVGTTVPKPIVDEIIPGYNKPTLRLLSAPILYLPTTIMGVTTYTDIDIVSVWDGGPTWDETSVYVYPEYGIIEPKNFIGFWYGPWKATYTAGRSVIDTRIIQAVKMMVMDMWAPLRGMLDDSLVPDALEQAEIISRLTSSYEMNPAAKRMLQSTTLIPGFA